MKQFLLLISLIFLLGGCASKRFVKKGLQLENSGLYSDAAESYYSSLRKNINNIDAKLGLQRTGQLVLDDKIDKFKTQYNNGTPKDAVYAFRDADQYLNKLSGVGIKLIFPEEQRSYYKEVEDTYLNKVYADATKALSLEQFSTSESLYQEILNINANYKDTRAKWIVAKYEPQYRSGKEQMANQMYRSAYFTFKHIIDEVKAYENSLDLLNQSLAEAKLTIYIAQVNTNFSSYIPVTKQLTNKLAKGINDIQSPLYEVVGVGGANQSSGNSVYKAFKFDRTKSDRVQSNIPKSKAILEASIQKFNKNEGKLTKTEKRGYVRRTEEYVDKETKLKKTRTVYDKVVYYEYKLAKSLTCTISYTLKRRDRDEVPISDSFNKELSDKLHYIKFDGDYKKLVPGTWKYKGKKSESDKVYDSEAAVKELQDLYNSKKTATSITEMENTLLQNCVEQITGQIKNYKPEN